MLDFLIDRTARARSPAKFSWTDENVERLRELHKKGLSDSQIAADLGCPSRSAIAGKINRLRRGRFAGDFASRTKAPAHAPRKGRGDTGGGTVTSIKARGGSNGLNLNSPRPRVELKISDHAPDEKALCLFLQLAPGQCRFPLDRDGRRWFCGAPQFDPDSKLNNYCAFHHRLTHQPIDRSKIRSTFQYHA